MKCSKTTHTSELDKTAEPKTQLAVSSTKSSRSLLISYFMTRGCFGIIFMATLAMVWLYNGNLMALLAVSVAYCIVRTILFKIIQKTQKQSERQFKIEYIQPYIQKKYQDASYLQDHHSQNSHQYAHVHFSKHPIQLNRIHDIIQGTTATGRNFEMANVEIVQNFLYTKLERSALLTKIQLSRPYGGTPVALIPCRNATDKTFQNLRAFKESRIARQFSIIPLKTSEINCPNFTQDHTRLELPQNSSDNLNIQASENTEISATPQGPKITLEEITLEEFLSSDFIRHFLKWSDDLRKSGKTLSLSLQKDMISINILLNAAVFVPHFSDICLSSNKTQARVAKEFGLLDKVLELAETLKSFK